MSRSGRPAAFRLALRLLWRQALAWAGVLVVGAIAITQGYQNAYPTQQSRMIVAAQIGANPAFQALNGKAVNLETLGGFVAWRYGGPVVVIVAIWGLLAATKLIRGEEETGHGELVLGGRLRPAGLLAADLAALGLVFAGAWAVAGAALVAGGLEPAGAFLVAMQVVLGAVTFAAVGALAAQLFDSRRRAATWAGVALAVALMLRVAADGTRTLGWVRWTTPLGWIENVRPFGGTNLLALIPVASSIVAAVSGALLLRARRDQGAGALGLEEGAARRTRLLTGPGGLAVLSGRTAALTWTVAVGAFAFVFGLLARGVSEFIEEGKGFEEILRRFGGSGVLSAAGFLGLIYSAFVVIVLVVYAGTQVSAIREEEATGRLDNVLVHPVGRARWLATRGAVAAVGAVVVGVVAGLAMWAGAAAAGSRVPLWGQIRAALNCLPVVALFLGIGVLAFGFVPRLTAAVTFGLVTVAYLIQLIGAIVDAPDWVLDLSPFHHVAAVPIVPANVGAALSMLGGAVVGVAAGTWAWLRRDIALA